MTITQVKFSCILNVTIFLILRSIARFLCDRGGSCQCSSPAHDSDVEMSENGLQHLFPPIFISPLQFSLFQIRIPFPFIHETNFHSHRTNANSCHQTIKWDAACKLSTSNTILQLSNSRLFTLSCDKFLQRLAQRHMN